MEETKSRFAGISEILGREDPQPGEDLEAPYVYLGDGDADDPPLEDVEQLVPVQKTKPKRKRKKTKKEVVEDEELDKTLTGLIKGYEQEEEQRQPDPEPPKKRKKRTPKVAEVKKGDDRQVQLLAAYGTNEVLGPYLTKNQGFDLRPAKLRLLSKEKLDELAVDIEMVLANKGNSAMTDSMIRQTMKGLEDIVTWQTKYKINGTTDKCFDNDHWRFLLERVKTKYGIGLMGMDPVTELSLVTFQTAALMHVHNKATTPETDLEAPIQEPLPPTLAGEP